MCGTHVIRNTQRYKSTIKSSSSFIKGYKTKDNDSLFVFQTKVQIIFTWYFNTFQLTYLSASSPRAPWKNHPEIKENTQSLEDGKMFLKLAYNQCYNEGMSGLFSNSNFCASLWCFISWHAIIAIIRSDLLRFHKLACKQCHSERPSALL